MQVVEQHSFARNIPLEDCIFFQKKKVKVIN